VKKKRNWFKPSGLVMTLSIMILVGSSVIAQEKQPADDNTVFGELYISDARARSQADYALKIGEETFNFLEGYRAKYNRAAPEKTFNKFADGLLKDGTDPIIQAIDYVPEQSIAITIRCGTVVDNPVEDADSAVDESTAKGNEGKAQVPATKSDAKDKEATLSVCEAQNQPECSTRPLPEDSFVEPILQCKTLDYRFVNGTWAFDSENSTVSSQFVGNNHIPSIPASLDFFECLEIVTDHCHNSIDYSSQGNPPPPCPGSNYPHHGDNECWPDTLWCPYWLLLVNPYTH
jgi:hypothetical protein